MSTIRVQPGPHPSGHSPQAALYVDCDRWDIGPDGSLWVLHVNTAMACYAAGQWSWVERVGGPTPPQDATEDEPFPYTTVRDADGNITGVTEIASPRDPKPIHPTGLKGLSVRDVDGNVVGVTGIHS